MSARMMGNVMGNVMGEKRLIFYVVKSLGVADEDDLGRHGGCRDEMGGCSVCMLDGQRCGEGGRRRLVRGGGLGLDRLDRLNLSLPHSALRYMLICCRRVSSFR